LALYCRDRAGDLDVKHMDHATVRRATTTTSQLESI